MGIIPEAFPFKVLAGYNQYKVMFNQENVPPFEYALQFSAIFKLPWILSFTHKKQEAEGSSPPLLLRQFSVKWWKKITKSQGDKEAVISYHNSLIQDSPSASTPRKLMTNDDIAKRIKDFKNDEDLARVINEIRGDLGIFGDGEVAIVGDLLYGIWFCGIPCRRANVEYASLVIELYVGGYVVKAMNLF
nr:reverse transcriptase domain, zinc finger, CCHC-type, aspartic peptidase domain protein [Tanacetum cinerariifolium]